MRWQGLRRSKEAAWPLSVMSSEAKRSRDIWPRTWRVFPARPDSSATAFGLRSEWHQCRANPHLPPYADRPGRSKNQEYCGKRFFFV